MVLVRGVAAAPAVQTPPTTTPVQVVVVGPDQTTMAPTTVAPTTTSPPRTTVAPTTVKPTTSAGVVATPRPLPTTGPSTLPRLAGLGIFLLDVGWMFASATRPQDVRRRVVSALNPA